MSMAYVGRKPCGCIVAAISDKPEIKKDIVRETGKWIRGGLTVEHVSMEYVKANLAPCKCHEEHP